MLRGRLRSQVLPAHRAPVACLNASSAPATSLGTQRPEDFVESYTANQTICYYQTSMPVSKPQFRLLQLFLALTAVGFALAAVRSSGLTCYALGAFAALFAGAAILEHNKYAGPVAFGVLLGIYVIRFASA